MLQVCYLSGIYKQISNMVTVHPVGKHRIKNLEMWMSAPPPLKKYSSILYYTNYTVLVCWMDFKVQDVK